MRLEDWSSFPGELIDQILSLLSKTFADGRSLCSPSVAKKKHLGGQTES
jgi:hypothetical protein